MDVAASEFYDNKDKTYDLNFKEEVTFESILNFFSNFTRLMVHSPIYWVYLVLFFHNRNG